MYDCYNKDPDAVLDYGLEWDDWVIGGDTIVSSSWEVTGTDSSLVIDSDFQDVLTTGVWLSGGTVGSLYILTNHIETSAGREDDRSFSVYIVER
ncbi:hypothetical protein PP304_gp091 [Gordonia phage Phendrix]|uniref:Minor tail protein n=2 Tax=Godonkavirus TaxID=2733178 RepID=A0A4D6E228_9CAUD|nr:minor tail protein [Gordonia phage GodonK]YP_010649135.1 hypothetical protein PP304_gp091 [Gordonia phage Phendrix]QBZ72713.1 minor tail protein [Gordonia phage GodonK]QDK02639.1 hypothetical protein SEA_PHENDRIX_91 [Gordonia phage Phendrix]